MADDKFKYDWDEARLFIFQTMEGFNRRINILEDRERDSQREVAVNKTTVAIYAGISGCVAGLLGTGIVQLFIHFVISPK